MGTIADLNPLTTPDPADYWVVRDVSDVLDKDKKVLLGTFGLLNYQNTWLQPQSVVVSNASPALSVRQDGAGGVLDLYDGATKVLGVLDGGQLDVFGTVRALTTSGLSLQDLAGNVSVRVLDGGGVGLRRNTAVTLANLQLSNTVFAEPAISAEAPAVASRAEIIQTWGISDNAGDFFVLANSATQAARFSPSFLFRNTSSNNESLGIAYEALPANDAGTDPCIVLTALRRTSAQAFSAIATRPVFEVRNLSTMVFKIWASNAVSLPYVYATTGTGTGVVVVDTNGTLAKVSSSLRYKRSVRDLEAKQHGDDFILGLRPVLYKDKTRHIDGVAVAFGKDEESRDYVGLIAEEVVKAGGREFVLFDEKDRPESLMYERLVVPLIGTVQRLLARVKKLETQLEGTV